MMCYYEAEQAMIVKLFYFIQDKYKVDIAS